MGCNVCKEARALVNKQAKDERLWFIAETAPEAYLQEALRKLHAVVEGEGSGYPLNQPPNKPIHAD